MKFVFALVGVSLTVLGTDALRVPARDAAVDHVGERTNQQPNVHKTFSQFNATRFLNRDQALAADWAHLPWEGHISSIFYRRSAGPVDEAGIFVIGVKEDSEFWWTYGLGQENPEFGLFNRLVLPRGPLNETSAPGYLKKWTFVHYHEPGSVNTALLCRNHDAASGFDTLSCGVVGWTGASLGVLSTFTVANVSGPGAASVPVKQITIEYSIHHPRNQYGMRPPQNLLFASSTGLTRIPFKGTSTQFAHTAQAVTLTNTTGSAKDDLNVTGVWCFPQWAPTQRFNASARPDAFHQGQCYANSANTLCLNNVCPPNLVHRVLEGQETYFYRTPGIIDRLPNGLAYDAQRNAVHMGNDKCLNLLYANDSLWRVDGKTGGLPMNKINCVDAANPHPSMTMAEEVNGTEGSSSPSFVWYGTEQGVNMMKPDGSWSYFYGPRWLPVPPVANQYAPGNNVVALAVANDNSVALVATRTGLSMIRKLSWTLAEKAQAFQVQHDTYHDRYGLSTGVTLGHYGNKSSWIPGPTCNDGLWSGIYLQGQCFRYAAETDPVLKAQAKHNAHKTFQGMKMLFSVTGIRGYPARSFKRSSVDPNPGGDWHRSPTMPGYWYDSATSNDEITGHMSSYPVYHDLVCTTEAEREDARTVMSNLMSHIVDHKLCLVGKSGKPTMWGHWSPHWENDDPFYYDSKNINSLEILSFLGNTYRVTGNQTYADIFIDLVDNHGYGENGVHALTTQVSDVGYDTHKLIFMSNLGILWGSGLVPGSNHNGGHNGSQQMITKLFQKVQYDNLVSIQRTFHYKQIHGEKSCWWNSIYAAYLKTVGLLTATEEENLMGTETGAAWCLETFSTSWIQWPFTIAQRLDIVLDPHTEDVHAMENILPYDENTLLMWGDSPYRLDSTGGGTKLQDPSNWLTPYWTARFFGLLNTTRV